MDSRTPTIEVEPILCGIADDFLEVALYDGALERAADHLFKENPF
jgi:hypothetical protein